MPKFKHATIALLNGATLICLALSWQAQERSRAWVRHSVDVMGAVQKLRTATVEARRQYDEYLAGGELEAYQQGLEAVQREITATKRITADNATQQAQLDTLSKMFRLPQDTRRSLFTDDLRQQMLKVTADEVMLLEQRQDVAEQQQRWLYGLTAICCVLTIGATAQAIYASNLKEKLTKRLQAILRSIPAAVLIRDRFGVCLEVLSKGDDLLLDEFRMVGTRIDAVAPAVIAAQILAAIGRALESQQTVELDYQCRLHDGRQIWFDTTVSAISNDEVLIIAADGTRNHELNQQLLKSAITDTMTGLYNRTYFVSRVEQEIAASARKFNKSMALLILDLDHLKQINLEFSHLGGDKAIMAIAHTLLTKTRKCDVASKLSGGDEFAVLITEIGKDDAIARAEMIRQHISNTVVMHDGQRVPVTVSVGVAFYPTDGNTFEALYQAADLALFESKREGRDRVAVAKSA